MDQQKIKILRVVTQAEVVPWHLKNFIDRSKNDYQIFVTGNDVSRYKNDYPEVVFIDNEILRKLSPLKDFVALVKLVRTCIKVRPHIIHSIMPKTGLLSCIAGTVSFVPVKIHTFTGQVWATMAGKSRTFYKFIDKVILKLCTACLTDSYSQSEFLFKNGLSQNGGLIKHLGKGSLSGVALNRFDFSLVNNRKVLRDELNIDENDFVFIFLARKSITKGIKELFESFAKVAHLPNVKLLFIGPDESDGYLNQLNTTYSNLSDKIINLDTVKEHEKYLALSDVLCIPSSSEGFGSIVIEAAALGVPSIGFDIVGLTDAIDDGKSGILVPLKDIDKFSKAMEDLYSDKNKLSEMKLYARNRVLEYFSADVIYASQKAFYTALLNKVYKNKIPN